MNKTTLIVGFLCAILGVFRAQSQTPQSFAYQCVIRDGQGLLMVDLSINVRFSILKDDVAGVPVFIETHNINTGANGMVSVQIGSGNIVSGSITAINWGDHSFFLKVEIDPENDGSYLEMGTSQLLAVPYALFAEQVANPDDDWLTMDTNIISANSGYVGVGLYEPEYKFHVNGGVKIEDTLFFKGFENQTSGFVSKGQLLLGPRDIKIGFGKDNFGNVLIGNSIFGKTVFDLGITGTGNIGIGTDVFHETTTGSSNVCLGLYSGYNISSGSNNVFIGSSAGEHISTGGVNICIGSQSGNGRNGERNLFIGNRAGYAWDGQGSDNVFLGDYAGYATGASNSRSIFIGKNAGYENNADDNVYIGPLNTGRNSNGSRNIFLGYEVGQGFSGSHHLLIDHENNNIAPFIKGDMENDHLEVNADLDVNGRSSHHAIRIESVLNLEELVEYPSSPEEGDLIYLNDTLRFYTGVTWKKLW